ncbi:MAG TPA: allantoinase AllB [Actinospica sp.]|jgi:allantoinase|nr:allantoinase AllB [Actinospica sp.]
MTVDLVLRSRRTVLPDGERAAAVAIRNGVIQAITPYDAPLPATQQHDLGEDLALLPGLVDTHVHVNEPGRTEWEGFASATRAAALGGVTTLIDMPLNSLPPTLDPDALEIKRKTARDQCYVDVGFWGGAVPGNAHQLAPLDGRGVFGFKCFLADSGVPEFPPVTRSQMHEALRITTDLDSLLIVHAEDAETLDHAPHVAGRSYADFLASRPPEAETAAIAAVIEAARRTGGRAHILHLASSAALPLIARAKAEGVRITAETCPHYLTFNAEAIRDGATDHKCCPPIRSAEDRERLWAALGEGLIDCIVSDHSPCTPDLKRQDTGDFAAAWGGIASLQLGLCAIWTEAAERGFTLHDVTTWMAHRTSDLVDLRTKGRIAVGCDADFVVFDPDARTTIDAAHLAHKNPVTPYDGLVLRGAVKTTYLAGTPINLDAPAAGRLLTKNRHVTKETQQ